MTETTTRTTIRQLTPADFETLYAIWEEGIQAAFTNASLSTADRRDFYRQFFLNALQNQDQNFKFWGYFEDSELVGWQSLLPCQSAPMIWHKFAESSTYIRAGSRYRGVGKALLQHAIYQARHHSELAYIMGYVSDGNPHVEALVQEVGFQRIGPLPKSAKDDIVGRENRGGAMRDPLGRTLVIWVVSM
jgi:L-amino acid N-acyltransferase YncA